jgi:YbgC/YbaW family acyl-CoA thioester hydrolase
MKELKTTLESRMKVRFHDCDPFNHLNNSRYIDYIMTARTDQLLDDYDFDVYRIAREQAVAWVSAQTQINYLSPAFLAEELLIQTRLISFGDRSLVFEALMWNSDQTVIKAVLWARLVHFNLKTQKSHQHSETYMKFFEQVVNPLPAGTGFEERVADLKKDIKPQV